MQALHFHAPKTPLELVELPDPQPGAGEVLVDVRAVGLCHTDVGYLEGHFDLFTSERPFILGHEVAGVVSALGEGVTDVRLGDRVALHSLTSLSGIGRHGGYAEKTVSVTDGLVPIPDEVPFDQAAVATDAGQTAYHAVARAAEVTEGMRVAIIGLGGLGFFGAQIAAQLGAEVTAAEPNEAIHQMALSAGVHAVIADAHDLPASNFDRVIDFAGYNTTPAAIAAVREYGTVVQVGVGTPETTISLGDLIVKNVSIRGIMGGSKEDIRDVMELIAAGKIASHVEHLTLQEIPNGLHRLQHESVGARLVAMIP